MTRSNLVGACDRQVSRLLALEDAIDVSAGAPVLIGQIPPVGDQAAPAANWRIADPERCGCYWGKQRILAERKG